ncbi:hypothetical protein G210_3106 [Candida maltosa Xu316]|uniref:Uncharacterized protein n=1 Tax=Candida maltosa (strain Xu316) TaxID=1245528 RepID=M3J3Y7_CANMX|nr:hypothetical protein G210_3106 [Candida maltosa Xu316]
MVKLIILKFTESEIVFKEDESYQILNHCCFLDEIESYMKKIYYKYSHEDNEDTNLTSSSSNYYDISDSTLEYSSESEDNYTEFDGKHLESLKSNDTLIDEFKRKFNDISDEEKSFTKTHDFINNMSNLRHNDEDTVKSPTPQVANLPPPPEPQPQPQSQPEPEPIKEDYNPFRLDDLAEVDCEHEDDFDLQHIPDPSLPLPFSPAKRDFDEDDEIIKISKQPSFVSPTKNRRCMSLSQMTPSNFSMISDEKYGLEYAYNSDHSNVPSFIKDNKKFKFIKVGKVQKFVNLFEEHQQKEKDSAMNSRINSRKPSRMTSRSGSPGHN